MHRILFGLIGGKSPRLSVDDDFSDNIQGTPVGYITEAQRIPSLAGRWKDLMGYYVNNKVYPLDPSDVISASGISVFRFDLDVLPVGKTLLTIEFGSAQAAAATSIVLRRDILINSLLVVAWGPVQTGYIHLLDQGAWSTPATFSHQSGSGQWRVVDDGAVITVYEWHGGAGWEVIFNYPTTFGDFSQTNNLYVTQDFVRTISPTAIGGITHIKASIT